MIFWGMPTSLWCVNLPRILVRALSMTQPVVLVRCCSVQRMRHPVKFPSMGRKRITPPPVWPAWTWFGITKEPVLLSAIKAPFLHPSTKRKTTLNYWNLLIISWLIHRFRISLGWMALPFLMCTADTAKRCWACRRRKTVTMPGCYTF